MLSNNIHLHTTDSVLLCCRSRNKQGANFIRQVMSFFRWCTYDGKTTSQRCVDVENDGIYVWTPNNNHVKCDAQKYKQVLKIVDQISKIWKIEIKLTVHLDVSRE